MPTEQTGDKKKDTPQGLDPFIDDREAESQEQQMEEADSDYLDMLENDQELYASQFAIDWDDSDDT